MHSDSTSASILTLSSARRVPKNVKRNEPINNRVVDTSYSDSSTELVGAFVVRPLGG